MTSATFHTTGFKQLVQGNTLASLIQDYGSFAKIFRPDAGVWWLHCDNLSQVEIHTLASAMRLHELTTEDILRGGVPDKFEQFDHYFFVVYGLNDSTCLYLITTLYGVLTILCGDAKFDVGALRKRLQVLSESFESDIVTPEWVTYAIIDTVTDFFGPQISKVEKEANIIERELFLHNGQTEVHPLLNRMCRARDASVELMRLFQGKPALLKGLLKRHTIDSRGAHASSRLLLSAHGHLTEMNESTFALEAILGRSFNNYISIMRVKMVHSNSAMEQIAGAVALVGLVLIPSHLITSAWAMNVPVPGQDASGEGWFWGVISFMTAVVFSCGVVGLWYYRRAVNHTHVTLMKGNRNYQNVAKTQLHITAS